MLLCLAQVPTLDGYAEIRQNTVASYLQANRLAGNKPNSLIQQNSPYLLQHAYNPVQWYAWGDEAFELARKQDKPIFLSIGYSTCYWCHVMAHESFENEKIAALLNEHFISIKLDREERPDIDNVYMAATELVNGYGGWPMTVFLNHDLEPFHAGVYYPPFTTDSSTGLFDLLEKVNRLWREERARIELVAEQITAAIRTQADVASTDSEIRDDLQALAMQQIRESYDTEYGGFGDAPKFPRPGLYMYLLSVAAGDDADADAERMLRHTLIAMAGGGLYDHVGGGFHRYSVDQYWQVPHFEKMLYTQALMALAYVRLYRIEPDARYREVATATLDFVLNEMRDPQGGFYSALDASSERPDRPGEKAEGVYYLWRAEDMQAALNEDEWKLVRPYFGIRDGGNIESDPRGEFKQLNILYISDDYRDRSLTKGQQALIASAIRKLQHVRAKRPRPHLDDKIITAWNGMMIRALVEAGSAFDNERYLEAAAGAADFLQRNLWNSKTRTLFRHVRAGRAGIEASLVDYAWYANALLALYAHTGDRSRLELARQLTERQVGLFHDPDGGGFYESASDHNVLFRSRSAYDGALPAPNAIAIDNLYRLAGFTGEKKWRRMADRTLASFAPSVNSDPASAGWMLSLKPGRKKPIKKE